MMQFSDKFLPNQWENKRLNLDAVIDEDPERADLDMFDFVCRFNDTTLSGLDLIIPGHTPAEMMSSNPVVLALLQFLVQNKTTVLEIGTYIGISAIFMARAMPGGKLWTVELGEDFAKLAEQNISLNRAQPHVRVFNADGLTFLRHINHWDDTFKPELIFLDADKQHYDEYLTPLMHLLTPGGLLVVDDVLFHGDVLNPEPTTEKGLGCKRMLQKACQVPWPKVLLPISNGVLIMKKPTSEP